MQGEKVMSREGVEKLTKLLVSGEALRWIREFEAYRSGLANVEECDRPDKRTTVFVDAADLVWAWISEPGDNFRRYAEELISREKAETTPESVDFPELTALWPDSEMTVLSQVVEQWEFSHPPFVGMVDADGGIIR
ncbi:hypothetical protein [Corynebacterium silvaticum]|uniref:Uncharacterized protein n=1 Tax=Corynebacterium silvaticum TaxID=2320431 RepID=A0ACD4PYD4_9CORY|nr:hypothetical protein [Corynebacterium silvaticum]UWG99893.1 hypothetical protein K1I39_09440 [Corynebacterium silvaticum]UWH01938.1 hypothetical protein K1I38_09450 [Corynebacterium silvaticum]UWH03974.1 hypothetical protein K1I36_09455 [Corynebacterium silvaticum]UXZ26137.1 hypothetical protein K3929_09455 [Corynebacterium silvaticum]UXZ28171.1 hypothetical protein K3930_09435 [Corynebacterium silvaticum]